MDKIKILIMSDIHRSTRIAARILDEHRDSSAIVFLGDGVDAFETAMAECGLDIYGKSPAVYQVAGNCDWDSLLPITITMTFGKIKICATHGHGYSVRSRQGVVSLSQTAAAAGCVAALYGHTHSRANEEINGVAVFNPGAVQNGDYGLAYVENGILRFEHRQS